MNEFQKARIKLTAWYILVTAVLLGLATVAAVQAERVAFERIEKALADPVQRPRLTALLDKSLNEFHQNFRRRLYIFDLILLFLAAPLSYLLSGRTLKPIQEMLIKQQEFSADASHELRTPLTTISMEIEALQRSQKNIPGKFNSVFKSIQEEVLKMRNLVDGLLTLVRQEDSKKNWKQFDLLEVAKESAAKLKPQAEDKKITLNVILGSEATPESSKGKDSGQARMTSISAKSLIQGNPEQIKQVITILLDNAIKYTQQGGKISVSLDKKDSQIIISVKDNGPGIPKEDLPHIFDRFYRSKSNKQKGSGLGLAIAKKIVENHEGKISVESTSGQGSIFRVSLPYNSKYD